MSLISYTESSAVQIYITLCGLSRYFVYDAFFAILTFLLNFASIGRHTDKDKYNPKDRSIHNHKFNHEESIYRRTMSDTHFLENV